MNTVATEEVPEEDGTTSEEEESEVDEGEGAPELTHASDVEPAHLDVVGESSSRHTHADSEQPELSPLSHTRNLSRSPPASRYSSRSRHSSVSSLDAATGALSIADSAAARRATAHSQEIKGKAQAEVTKSRARQQRKYHAKKGARLAGRPKGSKAKFDGKITVDSGGFWG